MHVVLWIILYSNIISIINIVIDIIVVGWEKSILSYTGKQHIFT